MLNTKLKSALNITGSFRKGGEIVFQDQISLGNAVTICNHRCSKILMKSSVLSQKGRQLQSTLLYNPAVLLLAAEQKLALKTQGFQVLFCTAAGAFPTTRCCAVAALASWHYQRNSRCKAQPCETQNHFHKSFTK